MSRGVQATPEGIQILKEALSRKRLTYEKIAEQAELSEKTVSRFFNREKVDWKSACPIIEALGLRTDEVLSAEDSSVSNTLNQIEKGKAEEAKELVEKIKESFYKLKETEAFSHQAMLWLESNRGSLSREAAQSVIGNENIDEISKFSAEIRRYLQIVYYSLEIGDWGLITETMNQEIPPVTRDSQDYADALRFIKEQKAGKELSPDESEELNLFLDYFISILPLMY